MNPTLKITLSTFILSLSTISLTAQETLKIVRGKTDTVFTAKHIITGVTSPDNKIAVNNKIVKVFKTGAFGEEVNLTPGNNKISIFAKSFNDKIISEEILNVFYDTSVNIKALEAAKQAELKSIAESNMVPVSFIVKSKKNSYLNYGNGTDRLGGAKINYLDEGIRLHVVGENKNLYKVQLSSNRYSFIPKEVTDKLSDTISSLSPTLSGSWSVINTGKTDRISISLGEKKPYTVKQEIEPNKIVLDLFGVQCNSNWITQKPPYGVIESVDIQGVDSDITRVIIYLNKNAKWGYAVKYNNNNLVIDVKHIPNNILNDTKNKIKGLKIGIDAGHGGNYGNGAIGTAGNKEKEQNLAMAYILKELLEREGASVIMSRESDNDATNNTDRLDKFRKENIDLLVSIHCNAGGNPLKTGGTSTYYRHIEHKELAQAILPRLLEIEGVQNFGLVGNFNFTLNSATDFPSVLVETLFISNLWDEEQIINPNFQKLMMEKTIKGLKDYLNGF